MTDPDEEFNMMSEEEKKEYLLAKNKAAITSFLQKHQSV